MLIARIRSWGGWTTIFLVVPWATVLLIATVGQISPHQQRATIERADRRAVEQRLSESADDRVADYTEILAWFTGVLAVVSVFQAYFIIRADRTSARTTSNAELAMITSQRAYLFAEGFKALAETPAGQVGNHWRFRPWWRNSGDTPPKDLVVYTQCVVTDRPLADDYAFTFDTKDSGTGVISAKGSSMGGQAPKQVSGEPNSAISPGEISQVQSGEKLIYLWGWASYNDVFPGTRRHLTHFCWSCVPYGDPMNSDINAIRWDYIQHTRGNYFRDLD